MQNAKHVVVVMNGTARWADEHKCSLGDAQRQSLMVARLIVRAAVAAKVRYLTLCGASAELPGYPTSPSSPARPASAQPATQIDAPDASAASDREPAQWTGRELTHPGDDLVVTVRLGQSGRRDIATAVKRLARAVQVGRLDPDQLDEALLRTSLVTAELPDPDLIVYSGCPAGEHRLRDDLIFESAYAEFFFSDRLWPDFTAANFLQALSDFASRQRRFGKTGEQVSAGDPVAARYVAASSSIGS